MKNSIFLLAAFLSISAFSQREHKFDHKPFKNSFTMQQNATLKTKRMALHLDLNAAQQNKVYNLILNQEIKHKKLMFKRQQAFKNGIKLSKKQQFNRINKNLDAKIYFKNRLKNILGPRQYTKFRKGAFRRMAYNRKKMNRNYRGYQPFRRIQRSRF